jgi:hypothetical protein
MDVPVEKKDLFTVLMRLCDSIVGAMALLPFPAQEVAANEVLIWCGAFLLLALDE